MNEYLTLREQWQIKSFVQFGTQQNKSKYSKKTKYKYTHKITL